MNKVRNDEKATEIKVFSATTTKKSVAYMVKMVTTKTSRGFISINRKSGLQTRDGHM